MRDFQWDIWNGGRRLKMRDVFHFIDTPITITDPNLPDHPLVFVNHAFTTMTGYPAEEVLGRNCRFLQGKDTEQESVEILRQAIRSRSSAKVEILNYTRECKPFWNELKISPVFDRRGQCLFYVGMQTDISLRVKGRQFMQESMKELKVGQRIQRQLLSRPIDEPEMKIDAAFCPSKELNGDLYYWTKLREHEYAVFLMDVMGSGVSSALINMSIRSALIELLRSSGLYEPEPVLKRLNEHMHHLLSTDPELPRYFFSAIYILVNTEVKQVRYVNAGHPPALVVADDGELVHLASTTVPMGLLEELDLHTEVLNYQRSLSMLLYTDGLIELPSRSLEERMVELEQSFQEVQREPVNAERVSRILAKQLRNNEGLDDICLISLIAP